MPNLYLQYQGSSWFTAKNNSCYEAGLERYKDIVFAFEVLEHLDNPYEAIIKIHKLLKKEGYFIGTTPYPFKKNIYADSTHRYILHPENWKKLFIEAGFSEVKLIPMSFLPFIWRLNKYINVRLPFYISLPSMISTCLLICKKK